MQSEIAVPHGNPDDPSSKKKLRNLLVRETGRAGRILPDDGALVVVPESPVHARQVREYFDSIDVRYKLRPTP